MTRRSRTNEERRAARIDKLVNELTAIRDFAPMKMRLRVKRIVLELRELRRIDEPHRR